MAGAQTVLISSADGFWMTCRKGIMGLSVWRFARLEVLFLFSRKYACEDGSFYGEGLVSLGIRRRWSSCFLGSANWTVEGLKCWFFW